MRFIKRNAIALTALVFAMTGTSIAASRYLVTSTSQISPAVREQLRAEATADAALAKKGAHAVVARARSMHAVSAGTESTNAKDPMSGATWTQQGDEDELFFGEVAVTYPTPAECGAPAVEGYVVVLVDGNVDGEAAFSGPGGVTQALTVKWGFAPASYLFEPGKATSHTITVQAYDNCPDIHATVDSASVDVAGLR